MTAKSSYHNMAYEVTKRIAGRAYRYRVESVRDPATGKRRSRWTYLGRGGDALAERAAPKRRTNARERLLDALERLVSVRDFAAVTAGAIAAEAGLAHGTFYRHFGDKRAALVAAFERIRERRGPVIDSLRDDASSVAEARAGLRALAQRVLRTPLEHPALLRAFYALSARDEELAAESRERKRHGVTRLAEHLAALARRGLARVEDAEATAGALFAMLDGFFREALADGVALDDARIAAAAEVMERAVFCDLPRSETA